VAAEDKSETAHAPQCKDGSFDSALALPVRNGAGRTRMLIKVRRQLPLEALEGSAAKRARRIVPYAA